MLSCVVSDPPWRFGDSLPGETRGAGKQYPTMTVDQIAALNPMPVEVMSDSILFLWRVAAMQEEALRVARAWGYVAKAELVWVKLTSKGNRFFGMGRYTRAEHETCLIAARGRAQPLVHDQRSTFRAEVREHSRKPDEFYEIVERMYPHALKFEMFARTARKGWLQSGLELGKFDPAPPARGS